MEIVLDGRPGADGMLRGRLLDPPSGVIEVSLRLRDTTPFGEHVLRIGSVETSTGSFSIEAPRWPVSRQDELIQTEWMLEACSASGESARIAVDVRAPAVTTDSVADDDRDAPAERSDRWIPIVAALVGAAGLVGFVTAFGTGENWVRILCGFVTFFAAVTMAGALTRARQRAALGDVRCWIEPIGDQLVCHVVAHPRDSVDQLAMTATLYVVEMVRRSTPGGGPLEHEHVIVEHLISLERADDDEWRGAIPLDVAVRAPLSRDGTSGDASWAVSWVVRIRIEAPRVPTYDRAMPLLAVPTGLDPSLRPTFVDIPKAARS